MKKYFEGYYYKHQKQDNTLCFIVGRSSNEEFIQIITNNATYHVPFIGDNIFCNNGIKINIKTENVEINGEILYGELTPIKYDIMGVFKYFPMECRHGIISMYHKLYGSINLNNTIFEFNEGVGYIEKDSGISFPKSYVWMQCNDFKERCSVMVSIAHIPFYGFSFQGCICVLYFQNKEYRFATYLGAKILCCTKNKIILQQGKMKVEFNIESDKGFSLNAPNNGIMVRKIIETPSCPARIRLFMDHQLVFDISSDHASFEYEYNN